MPRRYQSLIGAMAVTVLFIVLGALFFRMGSCGPINDFSAVYFFVALPPLYLVSKLGLESNYAAWPIIAVWIFSVSWVLSWTTLVLLNLRKKSA